MAGTGVGVTGSNRESSVVLELLGDNFKTCLITHRTSSTASLNAPCSSVSVDLIEVAHHAVDMTTRNSPFWPHAQSLPQSALLISLENGHPFSVCHDG